MQSKYNKIQVIWRTKLALLKPPKFVAQKKNKSRKRFEIMDVIVAWTSETDKKSEIRLVLVWNHESYRPEDHKKTGKELKWIEVN